MISFEFDEQAAPQARGGKFTFGNGWSRQPTFFANLRTKSERNNLVDTINNLVRKGERLVPHLGGAVVEAQNAPEVLDGERNVTQIDLSGQDVDFTTFWDVLDNLNRNLIVDPNTDRLLFSTYRPGIESIRGYLPDTIVELSRELQVEEPDIEFSTAYSSFKTQTNPESFAKGLIDLQRDFHADLRIPPYYAIDAESVEEDIRRNLDLIEAAQNRLSGNESDLLAPVIPMRRSVFALDPVREEDRLEPPEAWLKIINQYRKLDADILFLKATNIDMEPDRLDKTDSDGMFNFFNLFRRFSAKPTFFLGLDEFAYILMAHGLDGYSQPLYESPYKMPKRGGPKEGGNHRKFLMRRKLGWETFDQLDSLGCNGPFCREYNGNIAPSDIDFSEQDTLRKSHWFWVRDQELRELYEAIEEDAIRPGLLSLFSDSAWKKNLTRYIENA